jgi:aminopeptidase
MNSEFQHNLEKYAEVVVKVGLNLQAGQRLMIVAPPMGTDGISLEVYPLVRAIAKTAYQTGSRFVGVNWDDDELGRIRVQYAAADTMNESASWKIDAAVQYIDNGDAVLVIVGRNPDLTRGLDPEKVRVKQQTESTLFHRLRSKIAAGETNWLAIGASNEGWATSIFPDLPPVEAVARLWDEIFEACRINHDDPLSEWERHVAVLGQRSAYLNGKRYTALKLTAPGTDLTIGLPNGHIWHGGRLKSQNGIGFVANIPTEEVSTMPHKDRVEGVVTTTRPLPHGGSLIENFTLKFSEGRVVNASATSGQEALDSLLNTDQASRALGEVAIVPHSSPISHSGVVFYNILYDENASNHLALGNAYRFSMEGGEGMKDEEFVAAGGNLSLSHSDFMIGSGAMDIDGITNDGTAEPVTRNGEWAFEV